MMGMLMRTVICGVVLACMALGLGGCSTDAVAIIDVANMTDRPVRVEMFTVDKNGAKTNYSTSLLVTGGNFTYGADHADRLPGMRARFTLESEAADSDFNAVTLAMPADGRRTYDLKLINARLTARELKKGRADGGPSGP